MVQYFSAGWVFPVSEAPVKNGVVAVAANGKIVKVYDEAAARQAEIKNIQRFEGAIVPGFINAHCHLELSHMLGMISEHTGLIAFIKSILQLRNATEAEIIAAAKKADQEMYENGIVAVGDISNKAITAGVKQQRKIYYHTFLEVLGFKEETAGQVFSAARVLLESFENLSASVVPHAPYSVSAALFKEIADHAANHDNLISIHNQETLAEARFFEDKTGDFLDFYDFIGIDVSPGKPAGTNSLRFHLPKLPKNQRTLLVHNTFTDRDDVDFAGEIHQQLYWCLCPNANLYIENNLPDTDMFLKAGVKVTLGTDSLASNHQLNILDEMMVLQTHKQVDFNALLRWATWNGAEFLGLTGEVWQYSGRKNPGIEPYKSIT